MLKLGIIGTNSISHQFIAAATLSKKYQLSAVYSRRLETAQAFVKDYENVDCFTDFKAFFKADFDVIYIASPNSLHFEQASLALKAGKHTIVEKPIASTPSELAQLRQLAQENQVFLFEAARNYQENAFQIIRDFLADQTIIGGHFTYAKYSSKMGDLLAGKEPNVFSADFSGGALMDLGVYTLYAAIGLIGKPNTAHYTAVQLPNTVDINGIGQLIYDTFMVTVQAGKNLTSNLPSEIYTTDGTLTLNDCQDIRSAIFTACDGTETALPIQAAPDRMLEEAQAFAQAIMEQDQSSVNHWLDDAENVHQTLYTMRQSANITFKADIHEGNISN
ncbi:Gfo/Idh/MocA family protein [Streptococcus sp. 20-1249]|uniref:Gfo/Idh/MocA family protein n=1 Tax=Streptococcus hepaticus TaxID=3349163 RepID=UPI003748F481